MDLNLRSSFAIVSFFGGGWVLVDFADFKSVVGQLRWPRWVQFLHTPAKISDNERRWLHDDQEKEKTDTNVV